ncbi:MAG TPA: histidine kinase [Chryseosolibacter sp.]|nr:histidine kinase [Chryseosolibacter sp.]
MFLAWLSAWTAIQTFLLFYPAGLPLAWSWRDALLTNLLIGCSSYAMVNGLRYYTSNQSLRLGYSIVLAIITIYATQLLAGDFVSNDAAYIGFFRETFMLRCIFAWFMISFISTITWLWSVINEQQESEIRRHTNEKLAREAELATLRQQLQPHFLFNSLNSISALAGTKPEEARRMIQQLSDFLRGTLKRDEQQLVALDAELVQLQLYLDIEKVRFGHRLQTVVNASADARDMKLPSLLLQPVVENAIKFGLYDTIGEITITITAIVDGGNLAIEITNPFDPHTTARKEGTGFGLASVQRRLYLLFARHDLVVTKQKDSTFITQLKIPQVL